MTKLQNKSTSCQVCGCSEAFKPVLRQLDQCTVCGFISYHDFDRAQLIDIYNDDYFTGSEYPDYLGQQDSLRRSMRRHLKQMWRYHPRVGTLLEVGCAFGLFLDEARPYFNSVAGIDICAEPTAYARNTLGLNVTEGEFLTTEFPDSAFDVICLWDTIEHLSFPEDYLARVARLLSSEGTLFLTTGDIGSINARWKGPNWRQIHPPSHLHYFSRPTITRLLDRLGFEVLGIETTPYYHTCFNIFASIQLRGGMKGRIASLALAAIGENLARRLGFWVNLGDIMFVAARLKRKVSS